MTRKEREEQVLNNKLQKQTRILKTLELFVQENGNISDEELAQKLIKLNIQTSSSTVGRDLSVNIKKLFIEENIQKLSHTDHLAAHLVARLDSSELTSEQVSILAFIKKKRKDNKHMGQIKGGTNSYNNNDILRDKETGQFNGSSKKRK